MKILNKKILILIFLLLLLFPLVLEAQESKIKFKPGVGIPAEGEYAIEEGKEMPISTDPGETIFKYFAAFYSWGLRAVGIVAVIMIMVAGFMWMSAGGNAQAVSKAKKKMYDALMGLILVVGAYWLLSFINPALVQAPKLGIGGLTGKKLEVGDLCSQCKPDEKCAREKLGGETLAVYSCSPWTSEEKKLASCVETCSPGHRRCPSEVVEKVSPQYGSKIGNYYFCCKCKPEAKAYCGETNISLGKVECDMSKCNDQCMGGAGASRCDVLPDGTACCRCKVQIQQSTESD